ncbi:hypothetical protein NBRC116188_12400 [Oceaniserpentilla sp. 4NH20-0058]|uniref:pyridoxamine 5'-phosphate oxidase family protein n=1 Tax=Oceaniserpentilla sp. 4NH20-0058 TaxID=3127660 RepID=UPI00310234B7
MNIKQHWLEITNVIQQAQKSNMHCAIASVDENGIPNITPIGTVFLRDDQSAYFFDSFTSQLASNVQHNPNVCLSAVNSSTMYWLKSFFKGRFSSAPGVRLYGTMGPLRAATQEELTAVAKRIKPKKLFKGSKLIWSDFTHVRDIKFTEFRPVQYPKMMEGLWERG